MEILYSTENINSKTLVFLSLRVMLESADGIFQVED